MTPMIYESFGDELTKIAVFKTVARGFGKALKTGWAGTKADPTTKVGKGLTLLGAGLSVPVAMTKDDMTGQGRSRVERTLDAAGNTVGGLAGAGAGLLAHDKLVKRLKLKPQGLKSNLLSAGIGLAAGIGGGVAGSRILTAPMRHSRAAYQDHLQRQTVAPQNPPVIQGAV